METVLQFGHHCRAQKSAFNVPGTTPEILGAFARKGGAVPRLLSEMKKDD